MITGRRAAIALLCLTFGDVPAAALDARAIFEASEHALAPAKSAPAIRLTMQGVLHARDQASRPEIPVVELPDRQSVVLVRDGRYRLESDTVFPGAIRFHVKAATAGDRHLDVVDIVGVHGRSGRPADLTEAVKLRRNARR